MSFVASLDNRTPFVARHFVLPDGEGGEVALVVVKASFSLAAAKEVALADEQAPLCLADEFRGDPKLGSPLRDADLCLFKPRVDLLLVDPVAHAPRGRPIETLFAELHVRGEELDMGKSLLVSGDRVWADDQPGAPIPFTEMPLRWERAYGGTVARGGEGEVDERNPLGVGFRGARSADPEVGSELPNVEDPGSAIVHRESEGVPACFGVVARAWLPRRELAGTFDEGWKRRRWPLWPTDYDPAFNQSAPADQQLDRYEGGATVTLINLSPGGRLELSLPHLDVPVHLICADRLGEAELRVDTVEIDPAARSLVLTARAAIGLSRTGGQLDEIVVGHVKPGWLRARVEGKRYVDLRGEAGADPGRPHVTKAPGS